MMKNFVLIGLLCLGFFLVGCVDQQKILKPTLTEQIVTSATQQQKPFYASLMELKGAPFVFIGMAVGGIFLLFFVGKTDTGERLGLALLGAGISGLIITAIYQLHAKTIADWGIVIIICAICIGAIFAAVIFYAKYIKTNKMFTETVVSAIPAFAALKKEIGKAEVKASAWTIQHEPTIDAVDKIKEKLAIELAKKES